MKAGLHEDTVMGAPDAERTTADQRHLSLARRFLEVYCRHHHDGRPGDLCEECADLLEYVSVRLERCPYDPKPKCKECPTHCYRPEYRDRIRQVMQFSGMYVVKRGRLDWLVEYSLM